MNRTWLSIQSRAAATFAYTAGRFSLHPMPHATMPFCAYRFWPGWPTGHTNGAPPSPCEIKPISINWTHMRSTNWRDFLTWHVSMPGWPPAQINDGSKRNFSVSRVPCNAAWHCWNGTIGNGTFFMITLYLPALPNTSLPQPLAKHSRLFGTRPDGGRQTVAMWSSNWNGSSNSTTA